MNNFLSLLKVQFLSLFGLNKIANKKRRNSKKFGILGLAILFSALIVAVAYVYLLSFLEIAVMSGSEQNFLVSVFSLSAIICLMFSFYSSGTSLYGYKDYEMLSAMPIRTRSIVLSKLFFTYLADLYFALLILIAATIAYAQKFALVPLYLIRLFIMAIFMPVFPMFISIVLGMLLAYISSRFRKKTLVQTILFIILYLGLFGIGFLLGSDMTNPLALFDKIYFLAPLIEKGADNFLYLLLFALISISAFIIIVGFTCLTYKKMYSALKATKKKANFKLKGYGQKSQFSNLLKKEIKTLFSYPTYTMNILMGSIMALVGSIVLLILVVNLGQEVSSIFLMILHMAFAFSLMISPSTAVSLSVEGNTFYILRTSPISMKKIINVKLLVNLIFAGIPAFVGAIAYSFTMTDSSAILIIESILCATLYPVLAGNLGMIFNMLFPYMKWENITKAVKQSISVLFTVLCGMTMAGLIFVALFFLEWQAEWIFALILATLLLLSIITYIIIDRKGEKLIIKKT